MTFSEASRQVEENLHLIGTIENNHIIEDVITLPEDETHYQTIVNEFRHWRITNPNEHFTAKLTLNMVSGWRAVKVFKSDDKVNMRTSPL